jgi:hypothetical protein
MGVTKLRIARYWLALGAAVLGCVGLILVVVATNIDLNGSIGFASLGSDATDTAFVLIAVFPAALLVRWLLRAFVDQPRKTRIGYAAAISGIALGLILVEVFFLNFAWFFITLPIACAHGC